MPITAAAINSFTLVEYNAERYERTLAGNRKYSMGEHKDRCCWFSWFCWFCHWTQWCGEQCIFAYSQFGRICFFVHCL